MNKFKTHHFSVSRLLRFVVVLFCVQCLFFVSVHSSLFAQDIKERDLKELTVKPKRQRYHRKGNPAVELMRKVIAAKADHEFRNNDFVRYNTYQRITYAYNNISKQAKDSLSLFQKPLLKRQIEYCPQTGTYILPFGYTEKAVQHLFSRSPKRERNYVLGTHSEGVTDLFVEGDMVNTVLQSIFTDVNIYDDVITLFERKFTSPLSSRSAISFFQFFILDTCEVEKEKVIRLNFVPQNPQDFGFSGYINILADSTYRVQQCTLKLPLRSSVNFVSNLVIEQRFIDLPNGQRVLRTDDLFAEFGIVKSQRLALLHRSTQYSAYSTDSIPDIYFFPSDTRRQGSAEKDDEEFWSTFRADSLSIAERNLASTTDELRTRSLGSVPMFLLRSIVSNYVSTNRNPKKSKLDIGPLMSTVSNNFIDGVRLRLGGQTTASLHPHLFFKGYAAYGTKSKQWYGLAEMEYSFLRKRYSANEWPRHSVLASFQCDVFSPSDFMWQNGRDKDNVWISFKTQPIEHLMLNKQWLARYDLEGNNHFDIKLQFKSSGLTPKASLFYKKLNGDMVEHFNLTDITTSLRWAPGEEVINTRQRRHVVNHNNPVFSLAHTVGLKGVLHNKLHYNLTEITAYERVWLNSYGRIDLSLRGGLQWNRVPFPLLVMPVANNSYIITRNMFSMINNLEFVNDRYVSFMAEWDLSGKLLNRIPLIKHLKWREVIGFKTLYGHLSAKNNPLAARNAGSNILFEMPSRNGETIVHEMSGIPYMELNVGLHNIFKIIRIDYVRRLNYTHYPGVKKHGFRFCLEFDF